MSPSRKPLPTHHDDPNNPAVPPRAFDYFRSRLDSGDYDALLGRKLRSSLRQAAQETTVEPEIGALRLAMARLLREEHDPTRLANGISRLAGVSVRAARLRPSPSSKFAELRDHVLRELGLIEAEEAAAAASQQADAFEAAPVPLPTDQELA